MSELPQGWATTQLGELASSIVGGGTPSKSNADYFQGTVPFMTVKDMHTRFIVDTQDHITEEALEDSASRLIPADTLVIASRMSLGKIARPTVPVAINQDLKAIFLHAGIDKTFVEYAWRAKESDIQAMGTGTTVKGIRLEDIRGLDVALAPSCEQTRIANQLDSLLTRVQACNDRFDAIPALLKRFRQTVLVTAHAGDLTEDWRVEHGHKLVEVTTLGSVLKVSSGNFLPAKDMAPNGEIPVFGGNGINGYHNHGNVQEKTLVIGRVGFYCGSIHLTPNSAWVTDNALIVRHNPSQTNREYLHYALKAVDLRVNDSSTAQPVISGQKIYPLPLRVPSVAEQLEIVRRVDALFALADRIEARCTAARTQAQRLTPLVLAKAFRGELVPQDPNDEPASVLLGRIASSNTAGAGKNKRKVPVVRMEIAQAAINL